MYKPPIFNRYLNRKWNDQDNDIMIQKLSQARSSVDKACPESYSFFRKKFKKQKVSVIDTFTEKEVRRNNEILGDKIINIFSVSNNKKLKPLFEFRKQNLSTSRKLTIQKIEMDNQLMLKRLSDKLSCYDKKIWIKDFEKSQGYKKNICVFPSIKFYKDKEYDRMLLSASPKSLDKNNPFNTPRSRSKTSYQQYKAGNHALEKLYGSKYFQNNEDSKSKLLPFGYTASNFYKTQNPNQTNNYKKKLKNPFTQANRTHYLILEKNLIYSKKVLLENFGECYLNFHMENKKFYLCIKPIIKKLDSLAINQNIDPLKKYVILFDKYEESLLSKIDEMISQLAYYPKYDLMYLHKEDEDYYRYKSYWIKGKEIGQIIKSSNLKFSSDYEFDDYHNHNSNYHNNNFNRSTNQTFLNKSQIKPSNNANETQKTFETKAEKDRKNELINKNAKSKQGGKQTNSTINEAEYNSFVKNENKENVFADRNILKKMRQNEMNFSNNNTNHYNRIYNKSNLQKGKNNLNDENLDECENKNQRKISQISDNMSAIKNSKIENFVNFGSKINRKKPKSIKGSHSYQKSQTLNNIDISENKKNYLEENINDIIQSIENSER